MDYVLPMCRHIHCKQMPLNLKFSFHVIFINHALSSVSAHFTTHWVLKNGRRICVCVSMYMCVCVSSVKPHDTDTPPPPVLYTKCTRTECEYCFIFCLKNEWYIDRVSGNMFCHKKLSFTRFTHTHTLIHNIKVELFFFF